MVNYDMTDPNQVDPDFISGQQSTRYMDKYQYTSMLDVQKTLIGYGLSGRNMFNAQTGGVNNTAGIELINQSINSILSTREGERFFMPNFGSRLYKLIFQPDTTVLYDLIESEIKRALGVWEQRIDVTEVTCASDDTNENQVNAQITYRVKNTSMVGSYVYPLNTSIYDMESGITGQVSRSLETSSEEQKTNVDLN